MKKIWDWLEEHAFIFCISLMVVLIIWVEYFVKR